MLPVELISAPLIEVDEVSIYRGEDRILEKFSLTVWEGQHLAILGPNGCGKSTLIRTLTRELYPYGGEGTVKICGVDRWVIGELRTLLAVVSEEPRVHLLGDPTGRDLAVSGLLGTYGVVAQHHISSEMWGAADEALENISASHLAARTVETMSTGERRRCWIARALVSRPKALVLDEPTNGLDLAASHEFNRSVGRLAHSGITLILVTHHLEEIIPEINRVLLMKKGRVVDDGRPDAVLTTDRLANLFSVTDPLLIDSIEQRLEWRNEHRISPSNN